MITGGLHGPEAGGGVVSMNTGVAVLAGLISTLPRGVTIGRPSRGICTIFRNLIPTISS